MAIDGLENTLGTRRSRRFIQAVPTPPAPAPSEAGRELAEIVAQRFAALGDPNRVKIVEHLCLAGEQSVQDVASGLDLPHPNVSRHLNVLFAASIVARRKHGNKAIYWLDSPSMVDLLDRMHAEIEEEARRIADAAPLASLPDYP